MQLLMKTFLICGLMLFLSCDNSVTENNQEAELTDSTSTEAPVNDTSEDEAEGKIVEATYESATTYAAVSDFNFTTADGNMITVRGNTFGEEETIEVPDNMLEEDSDEREGPLEANLDLVGKKFRIYYNGEDVPVKIELAE